MLNKAKSQQAFVKPFFPESGISIENFVPLNWEINEKATGDLNNDGIKDFVVLFKQRQTEFPNKKILLILLYNDSIKAFKTAVVDYEITESLTMESDIEENSFSLDIKKGQLIVGFDNPRPGIDKHFDYCFLFTKSQFKLMSESIKIFYTATGKLEKKTRQFVQSKLLTITNFYHSNEIYK